MQSYGMKLNGATLVYAYFFEQGRSREIDRNGEKGSHLSGIVKIRSLEMDDVNYKSLSPDIIH